jgi:S1-C subfamily serine protease
MKSGREGRHPNADQPSTAFNPWAPRAPGSAPSAPPAARTATASSPWGERRPTLAAEPPSGPPPTAELGGRAPVIDDDRPAGAPGAPPTGWPAPRLPGSHEPAPERKPRHTALAVFCAFLVGAALVGAAFGSYALGDRRDEGNAAVTTTAAPVRATDPLNIQKILDIARPSVVTIQTGSPDGLFGGAGSGVIISADGLILTNAHVIEGAGNEITIRYNDGTTSEATLVGASTSDDIALLQAAASNLTPAKLGSSANLLVGDPVVAIGNALNLGGDPSVTSGIVSAKDREISDGSISLDNLIQTDAAINPGNSGGPLVNANGEVVGINTAIIQGAQNIGFSIAIDSVQDLIETLKAGGGDLTADTAVLGVTTIDAGSPDLPQSVKDEFQITVDQGAVVTSVNPGSGAGSAGIQVGDVITEIDGQAVAGATDLMNVVRTHEPGEQVGLTVLRQGERRTFTVTLGP